MTDPRPTLVGMNHRRGEDPWSPDHGSSARRLASWLEMTTIEFLVAFRRLNILDSDDWDPTAARVQGEIMRTLLEGSVFVLGQSPWKALGLPGKSRPWDSFESMRATFTLVPHPSGRSRVYNSSEARDRLRRLLREALERSNGWGSTGDT